MGAVPKNKITRAERGKRRHGNRPFLIKDSNSAIPLHKQGFVAQMLKFVGMGGAAASTPDETTKTVDSKTQSSREAVATMARQSERAGKATTRTAKTVAPRTTSK